MDLLKRMFPVLLSCIAFLLCTLDAYGQETQLGTFEQAMSAINQNNLEEAQTTLLAITAADYGLMHPQHGAAAYWFGYVLDERGYQREALTVRRAGIRALKESGEFDSRLADAYVRQVFDEEYEDDYEFAVDAYLRLLRDGDHEILERHIAQASFLLADSQPLPEDLAEAGRRLTVWWTSQDPNPGQPHNSRVEEHLLRVSEAVELYGYRRTPSGFDDRGEVFVRLGPPTQRTTITMSDRGLRKSTINVHRRGMELADNEFWSYRHIGVASYYLFVYRGGRYQSSLPEELIPDNIQRQVTASTNFNNTGHRGEALLQSWQMVYGQLALYHPDFISQLNEVEDIMSGRPSMRQSDKRYVLNSRMRFSRMDKSSAETRDRQTPRSYSNIQEAYPEPLPVEFRTARFLDGEGGTVTEIFWTHTDRPPLPGATLAEVEAADTVSTVQFNVMLRPTDVGENRSGELEYPRLYQRDGEQRILSSTISAGLNGGYQLGLSWLERPYHRGGGGGHDASARFGSAHVDSLHVLRQPTDSFEISDLKPVFLSESGEVLQAYPYRSVQSDTPLGVYFEIYSLNDQPDQFELEYEIIRLSEESAPELQTSTSFGVEVTDLRTEQYVELDLQDIREEGEMLLRVTATRSSDQTSITRDLRFGFVR